MLYDFSKNFIKITVSFVDPYNLRYVTTVTNIPTEKNNIQFEK